MALCWDQLQRKIETWGISWTSKEVHFADTDDESRNKNREQKSDDLKANETKLKSQKIRRSCKMSTRPPVRDRGAVAWRPEWLMEMGNNGASWRACLSVYCSMSGALISYLARYLNQTKLLKRIFLGKNAGRHSTPGLSNILAKSCGPAASRRCRRL